MLGAEQRSYGLGDVAEMPDDRARMLVQAGSAEFQGVAEAETETRQVRASMKGGWDVEGRRTTAVSGQKRGAK
jgi:hypothetical protein